MGMESGILIWSLQQIETQVTSEGECLAIYEPNMKNLQASMEGAPMLGPVWTPKDASYDNTTDSMGE
jgi:hypothetical protein